MEYIMEKDPWNRSGMTYGELNTRAICVVNYENLPKNPEFGQLCSYLNPISGCTYVFVEWLGLLGWVWVADL